MWPVVKLIEYEFLIVDCRVEEQGKAANIIDKKKGMYF
ncbi:MAG: hypothetical protein SCARUB_02154 [Candidatus Scalindua rubra]|uniref:Uncharacterized protein n=1 Tax=Candidatus Scalindua rubra TaxID=1872076 RepID=A0A1E3XCL9_9BACT|nr:MAG: hypothetical protein SCARUB_02154 [Candidatus Scalindua rubra]